MGCVDARQAAADRPGPDRTGHVFHHRGEGEPPYWAAAFLAGWVAERADWLNGRLIATSGGARAHPLVHLSVCDLFDFAFVELVALVQDPSETVNDARARVEKVISAAPVPPAATTVEVAPEIVNEIGFVPDFWNDDTPAFDWGTEAQAF